MSSRPLVFDLDGTTIKADTSFELCLHHLKAAPFLGAFQIILWFIASRSAAKARLVSMYADKLDVTALPYTELHTHAALKGYSERALVSGSDDHIVKRIAKHLGGFTHAQGSTAERNLIGAQKAAYLKELYPDGFDYLGDSMHDLHVWAAAEKSYGARMSPRVAKAAKARGLEVEELTTRPSPLRALLKGMRMHQWSKNVLLLVPALLNVDLFSGSWIWVLALGFVAFGLVASATYLLNDLLDIEADRAHQTKRLRPFASGDLSVRHGLMGIAGLGLLGMGLAGALHLGFMVALLAYALTSLAYSFHLKRIAILDVFVLSGLFCGRVLAGGVLLSLPQSTWFVAALGFFFLALALGKRAIELQKALGKSGKDPITGRGYVVDDMPVVRGAGMGASFAVTTIVLIYGLLSDDTIITRDASAILLAVGLTYWQMRFWLLVMRGAVHDDPIVFALKDRGSAFIFALLFAIALGEQILPAVS